MNQIYRFHIPIFLFLLIGMVIGATGYGQSCQTITGIITSTAPTVSPADSVIEICQGESVTFNGTATFSNSGAGATYEWYFSDGTIVSGTTATKTFPNEGVYVADFKVTDPAGCVNKNCDSRVIIHVSTRPNFEVVAPATLCLNETATIHGAPIPRPGFYNCAPPVADTTFLPDGSGVSYTTSINVTCFTLCDTIETPADIDRVCLNMEHSYMGDLDWKIICPTGQSTILHDYSSGGGTIIGNPVATNLPVDNSTLPDPGIGIEYCFSPAATSGHIQDQINWTDVSPYTDPIGNVSTNGGFSIWQANGGIYEADGNWNNLVGCPLNGNWTIQVTDHLGLDNGYIFNWDIHFNRDTSMYSFLPEYSVQQWTGPDITSTSANGQDITIAPTDTGWHCYTFTVTDDDQFNCTYDTTICIYVIYPGNPGGDTSVTFCLNQDPVPLIDYLTGDPDTIGTWTGPGVLPDGLFDPAAAGVGTYDLVYTVSRQGCDTSAVIHATVANDVQIDFSYQLFPGCDADTVQFINNSEPGDYWWDFGDGTLPLDTTTNPRHIYAQQDQYAVWLTVENELGCRDSILNTIDIRHPLIADFLISSDSICQTDGTPVQFTDSSIGDVQQYTWDFGDGTPPDHSASPVHTFTEAGIHQVRLIIADGIPCFDTVWHPVYVDSTPFVHLIPEKNQICIGERLNLRLEYLQPSALLTHWNFGDGNLWEQQSPTYHSYEKEGVYEVVVTVDYPVCPPVSDTALITVHSFPVVHLESDTVLCLDGSPIWLENKYDNPPGTSWVWNTGDTTARLKVVHPGRYTLTATLQDCATTESVTVKKDCYTDVPNAFTPNGDGANDYFFPRQYLSEGVTSFRMSIFNRWGQQVFETQLRDGRGWDGKFNGEPQPMGVYIYNIVVRFKNGQKEEYTGNVTLIR